MEALVHVGLGNAVAAAALAVGAACLGRLARRPALAHGLWLLVLLKLLTPPVQTVELRWPVAPAAEPVAGAEPEPPPAATADRADVPDVSPPLSVLPAPQPAPTAPPAAPEPATVALPAAPPSAEAAAPPVRRPWEWWVGGVWLAGSVVWFALAGWRILAFRRVLRHARPAPAAVQQTATALATQLGLRGCPGVWLLPGCVSPMLWAVGGRPRLLLPAALLDRLSGDQVTTLLAHELAHLRRRDHWVRAIELLATGLYWWHPVVWWARREIEATEEACCDAWVVWALPARARTYANALLETLDFLAEARPVLPPAVSAAGHVPLLRRRLTMILSAHPPRALTAAGLLFLAVLGVALLPWLPTVAQQPAAPPPLRDYEDVTAATGLAQAVLQNAQSAAAPKVDPAEQIEQLKEEVELAEIQIRVKHAELDQVKAQLAAAERKLARLHDLAKQGAVDQSTVENARTELDVLAAQLKVKQAQVMEPELRLKQARRRLARLQGVSEKPAAPDSGVRDRVLLDLKRRAAFEQAQKRLLEEERAALEKRAEALDKTLARGAAPDAAAKIKTLEGRLAELEKKVQALTKEVETLRRQQVRGNVFFTPAPTTPNGQPQNVPYRALVPNQPYRETDPRSVPTVPLSPAKP